MIIKFLETFQKLEWYCYETKNLKKAQKNYNLHNLYSLLLIRNVKNGNIVKEFTDSNYMDNSKTDLTVYFLRVYMSYFK